MFVATVDVSEFPGNICNQTNLFHFLLKLNSYISPNAVHVLPEPGHPLPPVEDPVGHHVLLALAPGIPALGAHAADDPGEGGVDPDPLVGDVRTDRVLWAPGPASQVDIEEGLAGAHVERVVAGAGGERSLPCGQAKLGLTVS